MIPDFKGSEAVNAGVMLGLVTSSATQAGDDERRVSYTLTDFALRVLKTASLKAAE